MRHWIVRTSLISIACVVAWPLLAPEVFAHPNRRERDRRTQQVERTAPADARVTFSACTLSGNFTVRGWERNEVRVRVSDGVDIELTRVDQHPSQPASELKLTAKGRHAAGNSSCLASADIEIDLPHAGGVKITTTNGDISVTGIGQLEAVTTNGSITVANLKGEAKATTIGGELVVRDSSGSFKLTSTSGSIDVRELKPLAPSDVVAATTVSGEVTLAQVQHQHVTLKCVSGEATYSGPLVHNGSYSLSSFSGEVHLRIPTTSSFRLQGTVGESVRIGSDFNLKYAGNQDVTGPGNHGAPRRVSATLGSGDALIEVLLLNGSLRISKQ